MARPAAHVLLSTALAAIQWKRTGRFAPTIAPYVTGVLVDADHLTDLARFKLSGNATRGTIILPLHGWEYLVVLLLVERILGRRFAGGLALGYLGHLALDQVTNNITHPLTYVLAYRWRRGFSTTLFSHPDEADVDWMQNSVFNLWRYFL